MRLVIAEDIVIYEGHGDLNVGNIVLFTVCAQNTKSNTHKLCTQERCVFSREQKRQKCGNVSTGTLDALLLRVKRVMYNAIYK